MRRRFISLFVLVWLFIFYYESSRHFFLNPFFGRELPKIKFLFPPAGWIMFFNVDEGYGGAEVYGIKDGQRYFINPHDILKTKAVGYDNIHRNVLSEVLSSYHGPAFCRFLRREFPGYEQFEVAAVFYPSVTENPKKKFYRAAYVCE